MPLPDPIKVSTLKGKLETDAFWFVGDVCEVASSSEENVSLKSLVSMSVILFSLTQSFKMTVFRTLNLKTKKARRR